MSVKSVDREEKLNLVQKILSLTEGELRLQTEQVSESYSQLRSMDIAVFNYNSKMFMVLCVLNERTGSSDPFFTNTNTGNVLLSCFDLKGVSVESLGSIIKSLYKVDINVLRKIGTYRYFKSLFGLLLGKKSYKTFNKTLIGSMTKFTMK